MVFAFDSQEELNATYQFYEDLGWYESGLYYPWVYIKDNVLLQLSGILDQRVADAFGEALATIQ